MSKHIYFDTDAVSVLANTSDSLDFPERMHQASLEPILSCGLIEETLLTRDRAQRQRIAELILRLLDDRQILDGVGAQVKRGVPIFLAGGSSYSPFPLREEDEKVMLRLLNAPEALPEVARSETLEDHHKSDGIWDAIHTRGRETLQAGLPAFCHPIQTPEGWLALCERTDYLHDLIIEGAPPDLATSLRGRIQEFVQWNPVLRAYREQQILAIHRHAIDHPTAASKYGPKFHDYKHGAYAAITDIFVTNDKRFASALRQHSELGSVGQYEVKSLKQFMTDLHKG